MSELKAFTVETTIEPNCSCADCGEDLCGYAAYDNDRCLRLCGACAVHILQSKLDDAIADADRLAEVLRELLHRHGGNVRKRMGAALAQHDALKAGIVRAREAKNG